MSGPSSLRSPLCGACRKSLHEEGGFTADLHPGYGFCSRECCAAGHQPLELAAGHDDRVDPKCEPSVLVTICYFKPGSGKWAYTDERVEWRADPAHYTGWQAFEDVIRLKGYIAVCTGTPLGFPVAAAVDALALMHWHTPERRRALLQAMREDFCFACGEEEHACAAGG